MDVGVGNLEVVAGLADPAAALHDVLYDLLPVVPHLVRVAPEELVKAQPVRLVRVELARLEGYDLKKKILVSQLHNAKISILLFLLSSFFNLKPASEFESGPDHMKKFSKAEKCGMTYSVKMFG